MNKKTILITGATGFLGSHILKKLIATDYNIVILKRSFSNIFRIHELMEHIKFYDIDILDSLEDIFKENTIDIILHTATQYGRKEESIVDIVESNLMLPLNLIGLAVENKVKVFINTDTLLDKRVSSYSLSKKQFKNWLEYYSDKMVCVNVSLEHFYGAFDDRTKFVTFILQNLMEEKESIALTWGEQERDFIYIDDVVNAFMKIIIHSTNVKLGFYDYEIGSGKNIKIKDFIILMADLLNNKITKLNFGVIPYRENEVMESHVNLNAIKTLGWLPITDIEKGLNLTINKEKKGLR